jgi:hypothetical protein
MTCDDNAAADERGGEEEADVRSENCRMLAMTLMIGRRHEGDDRSDGSWEIFPRPQAGGGGRERLERA